jgi:hypothetical protein
MLLCLTLLCCWCGTGIDTSSSSSQPRLLMTPEAREAYYTELRCSLTPLKRGPYRWKISPVNFRKDRLIQLLRTHPACKQNRRCQRRVRFVLREILPPNEYDVLYEGKPKRKPNSAGITLVTQLSIDRVNRLRMLLKAWEGDLIAIVWMPNEFQVSGQRRTAYSTLTYSGTGPCKYGRHGYIPYSYSTTRDDG